MKRQALTLPLCGLVLFTMAGCTVYTRQEPTYAQAPEAEPNVVYVEREPPPERIEAPSAPPGPGYVQEKGHWRWDGHDWDWVSGRWEQRRADHEWEPGHWEKKPKGHVWREGRWRKH